MALDATPLAVATLPGIVAGPILRCLTRTEVSVWVACVSPDPITLEVRGLPPATATPSVVTVQPERVGSNLWMAVLTAVAPGGGGFVAGQVYEYELKAAWMQTRSITWGDFSLRGANFPTFLAPPTNPLGLVVVQTSCRKPHGGGRDALALAMDDLNTRFSNPPGRQPHLLIMSGDQIYADEVGNPIMPRVLRIAADLIGIDENDVFGTTPLIGGRGPGTEALGFTGASANHLWTFGEYMAMYLLTWSLALWPPVLPAFPPPPTLPSVNIDVAPTVSKESWDEELANLELHKAALPAVQRVLANVPSLMIFDDHEITDDWNIDDKWVNSVYSKPNGRRAITNGLLAYTLCQHWGNKPAAFTTPGTPERKVLDEVVRATANLKSRAAQIETHLGIPNVPLPSPPAKRVLRDLGAPGAIRYDITIGSAEGWPAQIIALDERTVREFPTEGGRGARISLDGLSVMLPPPGVVGPFTIIVAAAPVLGNNLVEQVLQPLVALVQAGGARKVDFESWSTVVANQQDLLRRLAAYDPVVVLSGDVHYGFTAVLNRTENNASSRIVQLTSSAAKNLEAKNSAIGQFSELILRLGLERPRATSGFDQLSAADRQRLLGPPLRATTGPTAGLPRVLPWDDAVDIMLGRTARDGASEPSALSTDVVEAYELATQPDWTYTIEPFDDPMRNFAAAVVEQPWSGWQRAKSLGVLAALQSADLARLSRMFAGLPNIGIVTFDTTSGATNVQQELRCPIGSVEMPALPRQQSMVTRIQLS